MSTAQPERDADRRLHELLAFLALVSDPLPDTVSYWDAEARCRFANRAFETWFGLEPAKMIGQPIRVLLGEALYARAEPHVLGALRGELQRFERIVSKVDGKTCHILGHYVPHRVDGRVVGFVALATDQSDQRKAEADLRELTQTLEQRVSERTAELRQSQERFRQVFEGAPLAVLTVDPSGHIGLYNPAAARSFGEGRTGEPVSTVFPDPGFGLRSDGTRFPIERAQSRIQVGDEIHELVFVTDLTERRRLEAERDEMLRRMVHTQKLEGLGVLAGGIAHDFNNLLTGITAHAGLLADEVDTAAGRESVAEIGRAARRAADLCTQLLAYAGRSQLHLRPADLSDLVEASADVLHTSARAGVSLRFELERDLPWVDADVVQLRTALLNLGFNAFEAVEPGGAVVVRTGIDDAPDGAVVVGNVPSGPTVYVEVADDGAGMDPAQVERIFDPFYTTKFPGRGLGLSAVQGIVRGHRGAVAVRTTPGAGTSVRVLLPAREGRRPEQVQPPSDEGGWRGAGRVLLADDERMVRNVARRALARLGFDVELVEDGAEAVERFRAAPDRYALVILDLTMPRMNGTQALAEIRAIAPAARVLLMSGYSADALEVVLEGEEGARPTGFLAKPFEVRALATAVRAALAA